MRASPRRIPYGVMNWAELVRECHFVDGVGHIRALEACKTPVFLRPKRFGKSLVCSMLAHFYDVALKDCFDAFVVSNRDAEPDAETKDQALAYRRAVTAKPDWGSVPLDAVVVEVCSDRGYNWIPLETGGGVR